MLPVDQTIFVGDESDCLEACVASVLELDLAAIGSFCDGEGDWWDQLGVFLGLYDLQPLRLDVESTKEHWAPKGYHLTWGFSDRDTFHSVVSWAGEMVHDPHPARTGLKVEEVWVVFVDQLSAMRSPQPTQMS